MVVVGASLVVVGSGVVMMQEGGVQEEREKSPVLPNTLGDGGEVVLRT